MCRDQKPLINARAESALEKPAFSDSTMHRRCIIPVGKLYERKFSPLYRKAIIHWKEGFKKPTRRWQRQGIKFLPEYDKSRGF